MINNEFSAMRAIVIASLIFTFLGAAPAATPAPSAGSAAIALAQSRLETMLETRHADPTWFSSSFLQQVSAEQVDAVIGAIVKTLGPYERIEFTPANFIAHFAKGTDNVLIHLDADNKIDGLVFKPPVIATTSSIDSALRTLREMPGIISYTIEEEGGSESAALNPSQSLAVGSSFKLAVLNALVDEIRRGKRRWSDVVPLETRWKTLPSGILRNWPSGTPLTLATYAAEMISISDNTAADALVHLVGAPSLRPYAAENEPFLTTKEVFTLKSNGREDLRAAYLAARTPRDRALVLRRVDILSLPALDDLLKTPVLTIEWHYSVRELCGLMRRIADLPLMSINPGAAEANLFRHIAYKGGSDVGIINMTTMVTTMRGTRLCFSATLNNATHDVDEMSFETAYSAALRSLASR